MFTVPSETEFVPLKQKRLATHWAAPPLQADEASVMTCVHGHG
jgi:hypothetical protein